MDFMIMFQAMEGNLTNSALRIPDKSGILQSSIVYVQGRLFLFLSPVSTRLLGTTSL